MKLFFGLSKGVRGFPIFNLIDFLQPFDQHPFTGEYIVAWMGHNHLTGE